MFTIDPQSVNTLFLSDLAWSFVAALFATSLTVLGSQTEWEKKRFKPSAVKVLAIAAFMLVFFPRIAMSTVDGYQYNLGFALWFVLWYMLAIYLLPKLHWRIRAKRRRDQKSTSSTTGDH